ncbi:hypothetical protein [Bacillus fonticola]|nr:hypothetical protein [Bacillus fonticola]
MLYRESTLFDRLMVRKDTYSVKWDTTPELFQYQEDDLLPM